MKVHGLDFLGKFISSISLILVLAVSYLVHTLLDAPKVLYHYSFLLSGSVFFFCK